jgi:LTXXQ motif family protein
MMRFGKHAAIAATLLAFSSSGIVPTALAQAQPGQGQAQPATPTPPPGDKGGTMGGGMMGQGGMMCADMMGRQADGKAGDMRHMMPMMQNMMAMMSMQSGMMAPHVEGRIAALRTELKITEAQAPQWNRFADALRTTASSMNDMHKAMMTPDTSEKSLPERMAAREQRMASHLASLKAVREALQPLYATFSDEQKKVADRILIGPMGMM